MATTIKLKRNTSSGNTPDASDLSLGELAINTADGKVFAKKGDNSVVNVATSANLSELGNDMWEVTSTTPTSAAGKPNGYVWYVV
jgi:hypothetical protein